MIKIKRINPEKFYNNLRETALEHDSKLNALGENKYYNWDVGFYYSIDGNKTTIYYETGDKSKSGGISRNKSFLLCKHIKIFKRDFIFCFLIANSFWLGMPVLLIATIYSLLFGEGIYDITATFLGAFVLFYLTTANQSLKLLDYIDEICE